MSYRKPYPPEVRERAVRMVFETQDDYPTRWGAIRSIAEKIGCSGEALRNWVLCRRRHKTHYADLGVMPT